MEVWHPDADRPPEPANDNGRLPWPEALFAMFLLALGAWGLVYLAARALGVVA
jgi:hypothetical protein